MSKKFIQLYSLAIIFVLLFTSLSLAATHDPTSNFVNSCVRVYIEQQMPGAKIINQQKEVTNIKNKDKPTWLTKAIWQQGNKQYFGEFIVEAQGKGVRSLRVVESNIREH